MKQILCSCTICSNLPEEGRIAITCPETGPATVTNVSEVADFSEAQHIFRITPELIRQHNPYKMENADACSFFDLFRRDFDAVLSNAFAEYVRSKMNPQLRYVNPPVAFDPELERSCTEPAFDSEEAKLRWPRS